ncbi:uncharacterized protein KGF55_003045 [Candida pseudojiufengensis]|uniref:uncharacterized protein n=1 Tax=Candida pseudojiufengensis TaxID=497109 RepID=UPI00222537C1|nr:uncharacterized protein KGF55_003045 [Candida pseudojiufengensis]KAI5963253.1 hypothetical protein KGF55_003045 [Candida pseudojiufengensis]
MNSIQTLLSNIKSKPKKCRFQCPSDTFKSKPKDTIRSKYDITKVSPFKKKKSQNQVPKHGHELRGIDGAVHTFITKTCSPNVYSPLISNKYMMIQFFPQDHIISNFRKSNISFIFQLFRLPILNDLDTERSFKQYGGKYNDMQFFKSKSRPNQSACGRSKLKSHFRQLFIDALGESKSKVEKLAGVYVISVLKVPVNGDQENFVKNEFKKLINNICSKQKSTNVNKKSKKMISQKPIKLGPTLGQVQYSYKIGNLKDNRTRFPYIKMSELTQCK